MTELIITEKPNAAKKVADALADGKPIKESINGVPYYKITHGKQDILVGAAVGHLYGLAEKDKKKGFIYPVFDIEWVPVSDISKEAAFSKKYLAVLKKLSSQANTFTVATDYDVEGEVIGYNVIRYICKQKDAQRMKFSTLTKPDLIKAYENKNLHIDWGLAKAGETRHYLDFYYGINLSRALTKAVSTTGRFGILSTGRVQGPALKIIVDREKEIKAFKPTPYWQLSLNGTAKQQPIEAWHATDKFWEKQQAEKIHSLIKNETTGTITTIEKTTFQQAPPHPFDLTSLQTEAYRCFGINPKTTLSTAQDLYTSGYISYPRTSSQQLPPAIGYTTILNQLAKQKEYTTNCTNLLSKKNLLPNNGKKTDPAHPAIYPTGITPKNIDERPRKIYDLIVKRFLATFGDPAQRETVTWTIMVKQEPFITKGSRTTIPGWHALYAPYVKLEEIELPNITKGDTVLIQKITLHSKETQPPKRYNPSSIIKELEKRGLGTKATRAEIIDTLYRRNYIKGEPITATQLGIETITVLEKYSPKILDEKLTKHFEEDMEKIQEKTKTPEEILKEARTILTELLIEFRTKEKEIGQELQSTLQETQQQLTTVGTCPACKTGKLMLRKGKYGKFIACDKYPECNATFKAPSTGKITVLPDKTCQHCQHPIIKIIKKKPQEICINQNCPSKQQATDYKEKPCPKCNKGTVILRKSIYGSFAACNQFPKCRYTERLKKTDGSA